jgi:hypothetical protein
MTPIKPARCVLFGRKFYLAGLFSLLCFWTLPVVAAPKTDTVIFLNGDRLTGEIKSLQRGHLSLNTDATGTIGIEWDKIEAVVSNQHVQVETNSGLRYFGTLAAAGRGRGVVVVTDEGPQLLDSSRVVSMTPIESGGFDALDIDLSFGYNFAKAGGIESGNVGIDLAYRSRIRIESMKLTTTISNSDTQESSKRSLLSFQHTRLWRNRWFSAGNLTLDRNDELGLKLRTSLGSSVGKYFVQSNKALVSLETGLQVSREDQYALEEDVDSLEALITFKWDWFMFDEPELDWSTTLQAIPSLTESGRVRGEIDTTLQWEIVGDLKWALSFYGSFDNQPKDESGESSDYGINTSIVYEF